VRQNSSTVQLKDQAGGRCVTETDDQRALMRGLAHGVILSMGIWTAALYLTLVLR
jgi:hypothetical protein